MSEAPKSFAVQEYYDSDGEPWALFVEGHVDIASCRAALIRHAGIACFEIDDLPIAHRWIRNAPCLGSEADEDYPWHWCEAGDESAEPVTGVRF